MATAGSASCLFCRIVQGDVPADVVHSSERVLAFRDLRPQAPVHILLIPKEHLSSPAEVDERHGDMLAEMMIAAAHLAKAEKVDRTGWRLVANTGPDAGQSVFHLHFHLLGGRAMAWPPG